MEFDYEPRYCFRLVPLQICCKFVIAGDILLQLLICGFFIKLAIVEIIFVPFGIVQLMLTFLSILFYIGIINESDKLMIPMIVAKVIIMLVIGTVTIFTWIAFILSLFSLIHLESPIKRLSTSTYLGLKSTVMTVCLIILILEGSIIHAEYKYIKKQMDQRNIDEEIIPFMTSSILTMKPTSV